MELVWSSFWVLKSLNTKLKVKRILETIWDAMFDDFALKWGRVGVGSADGRGLLEA